MLTGTYTSGLLDPILAGGAPGPPPPQGDKKDRRAEPGQGAPSPRPPAPPTRAARAEESFVDRSAARSGSTASRSLPPRASAKAADPRIEEESSACTTCRSAATASGPSISVNVSTIAARPRGLGYSR